MKGHIDLLHLKYFKNFKLQNRISYFHFIFLQNIGKYEEFLNENFLHGGVNITGFKFLTKEDKDAIYVVNKLKTNDIVARNYTMSVMF